MPARRGTAPVLSTDNTLPVHATSICGAGNLRSPNRRSAQDRRSPARSRSAFLEASQMVGRGLLGLQRSPCVCECRANRITPTLERVALGSSQSVDRHLPVAIGIAKTSSYRVSECV